MVQLSPNPLQSPYDHITNPQGYITAYQVTYINMPDNRTARE